MSNPQPFSWTDSRILIADDEPDMREIFSAWFRNLGCTVTEAADGREALDALARDHFDAIVTDVRMPRLDGVQLVRQLHRSGRCIPIIIFVSGHVGLSLPDAFDLGVEAVLSKPCEKKELINAVHRSLLRRDLIFVPPAGVPAPASENCIRESLAGSAVASQVAFSRSGVSLDVRHKTFSDSTIGFSLSFSEGPITHIAGWGFLRWTEQLPEGLRIGIEFAYLDEQSLSQLARWLKHFTPVSFIPKNCHSYSVTSASP